MEKNGQECLKNRIVFGPDRINGIRMKPGQIASSFSMFDTDNNFIVNLSLCRSLTDNDFNIMIKLLFSLTLCGLFCHRVLYVLGLFLTNVCNLESNSHLALFFILSTVYLFFLSRGNLAWCQVQDVSF